MSSDLLSLATFKSTTPTCFHWCFQWRKAISNVNYSQLLAFCLFLIKPPLTTKMHQPALAGTCVQHLKWITNSKYSMYAVCSVNEHNQPLCISSLQTAFLPPVQRFQHFFAFPEMYTTSILQTQGKKEKQTINHQKMPHFSFPIKLWDHEDVCRIVRL